MQTQQRRIGTITTFGVVDLSEGGVGVAEGDRHGFSMTDTPMPVSHSGIGA